MPWIYFGVRKEKNGELEKELTETRCRWFMPVILATWEVVI
jgi:hypothetical protein